MNLTGTYPNPSLANAFRLPSSCAANQVAKSSGSNSWSCADDTDTNTTYSAGDGLDLTGTTFKLKQSCAAGQILKFSAGSWACASDSTGSDWSLTGNASTNPATNFLGTTDNQALNFRVNNQRAFRMEPNPTSPDLIGGYSGNSVTSGARGATISGGGSLAATNSVTDDYGTVGGGYLNRAGDNAGATSDRSFATVGGGWANTASGAASTIGGGEVNTASGPDDSTVGGGGSNTASDSGSTVVGGDANTASGYVSAVGGGYLNNASGSHSTIGGGEVNTASGPDDSTVGGGVSNTASGTRSTVGGGTTNHATNQYTTIAGGNTNTASGDSSTVGGGFSNTASGAGSVVVGGSVNTAAGDWSVVGGRRAKNSNAAHDGVFLYADSNNFDFPSAAANEFAARATGGVRFVTGIDGSGATTAGVSVASGGGSWASLSDRHAKDHVSKVSGRTVLAKLAKLPIHRWSYKTQDSSIRHLGPMAQAFRRAFGLGEDAKHIDDVDAQGVAFAAIKGLAERDHAQRAQIHTLRASVHAQNRRIRSLATKVNAK